MLATSRGEGEGEGERRKKGEIREIRDCPDISSFKFIDIIFFWFIVLVLYQVNTSDGLTTRVF
jgi:hypothetical protein